jgi:hypothetical protein
MVHLRPARRRLRAGGSLARSLAAVIVDPTVNLCRDRTDDHSAAAFQHAFVDGEGKGFFRVGLQLDQRQYQRLGGGPGGLFVFGAEPRDARGSSGPPGAP